jgi:hypothetical protein
VKIFVAYPYAFTERGFRAALAERFAGEDLSFSYADERLENDHVLAKIRRMMAEADTCMFDITGNNSNVMLELGIALGEKQPGFVAVDRNAVTAIGADVVGWDQLRYDTFADLADKLHAFVRNGALPMRSRTPITDPYDLELKTDARDFFNPLFVRNGLIGHFDLTIAPVKFEPNLIPKDIIRDKIRQFQASYANRGLATAVPWDVAESKVENFSGGANLLYQHPEWGRYENARLRTSGLYRVVRVFSEDYDKQGTIRMDPRTLGIVNFIEQVTLFHILMRNVARQVLKGANDQLRARFVIDGLLNRQSVIDDPEVEPFYLIDSQAGADGQFTWDQHYALEDLERDAITLARKRIEDVFWSFGVRPNIIKAVQQRLIGKAEPAMFSMGQAE